jgi:hypothetical protein
MILIQKKIESGLKSCLCFVKFQIVQHKFPVFESILNLKLTDLTIKYIIKKRGLSNLYSIWIDKLNKDSMMAVFFL